MDWIKVLTRHVLFEYRDLKDSEFAAWVKIMALTAQLEHIPTREQMLQYVHYKTLDSLQCKLNTHSIDLQYILNKVLIDVQYVVNRREALKINTQRFRAKNKPVINDVIITSSTSVINKEKRREENIKHIETPIPGWIKKETWEAFLEMRKAMGAKPTDRAIELLITSLDRLRSTGQDANKILEQSTMNNWKGVFPIKEGGNGNGSRAYGRQREAFAKTGRGKDDGPGGLGIPKEYKSEPSPVVSEEERAKNLTKLRTIIEG